MLADPPPHVFEDKVGLDLVTSFCDEHWRERPDMHPERTQTFRAAIVSRARFIEDLVAEQADRGVYQYVILGAGLDTFAQRKPALASRLQIFEVDRPLPQRWKCQRLLDLGYGLPSSLHLVPVDFEAGDSWWTRLVNAGFDASKPAVIVSTGVSMYLTKEATLATLRQVAALAPGSTLAMTFMLPVDLLEPQDRPAYEWAKKGASASKTPFTSFYAPTEILSLATEAGFKHADHVAGTSLGRRYFADRQDGLRPSSGEDFLVATT